MLCLNLFIFVYLIEEHLPIYKYIPFTRKSASCAYALFAPRRTRLRTTFARQPTRIARAAVIIMPGEENKIGKYGNQLRLQYICFIYSYLMSVIVQRRLAVRQTHRDP